MRDSSGGHLRVLGTLVLVSACETFAYYGLRSTIVLDLSERLGSVQAAGLVYSLFTLAAAWTPLLGGIAVDLAGARRMAMLGGALLAAGLGVLALLPGTAAIYTGLGLAAFGSGLARVGVVALVADLYAPGDHRRDAGFTVFVVGAQIGAALGPLGTGWVAHSAGFAEGYAATGAIALAGVAVLALARSLPGPPGPADPRWPAGRPVAAFVVLYVATQIFDLALALVEHVPTLLPVRDLSHVPSIQSLVAVSAAEILVIALVAWLWLRLGHRQPSSPAKILLGMVVVSLGLIVVLALARDGNAEALQPTATSPISIAALVLVEAIALSMVSRLARPRRRGIVLGLWMSAPHAWALLEPLGTRALTAGGSDLALVLLPGMALAAGVLGYALLRRLGATEA
jgi:proton-dependent oligopeptide transporter, POT family